MSDGAKKKKLNQPETRPSRRQRQLQPEFTRLQNYAVTKPRENLFRGTFLFPFAANRAADTRVPKTTGDELTVSSDHSNPKAPGKPKPGVGLVNRQKPENVFQFDDPEETEATPQPLVQQIALQIRE